MKFAILGAGNTGKAYSAFLSHGGHQVLLYDRSQERLAPIQARGISATGVVEGRFPVPVTTQLEDCGDSDVILVCTVAAGHRPLAAGLGGVLRPGQIILVTNCCWGAVEFDMELGAEAERKGCPIGETGGQLILCSSPAPDAVYLKTVKKSMGLACVRPGDTAGVLERLAPVFPQLCPAANVLETGFEGAGAMLHPIPSLMNINKMDLGQSYDYYMEGITPHIADIISACDKERVAVCRALGVDALALGDMLVKTYKLEPKDSLYDLIQSIESYRALRNPTNTKHRFIVEDTMSGLVPLASVGHALGIPTPMMDAFVNIASAVCGRDFWKEGRTAEKLGMAGKTLEEIQEMVR